MHIAAALEVAQRAVLLSPGAWRIFKCLGPAHGAVWPCALAASLAGRSERAALPGHAGCMDLEQLSYAGHT